MASNDRYWGFGLLKDLVAKNFLKAGHRSWLAGCDRIQTWWNVFVYLACRDVLLVQSKLIGEHSWSEAREAQISFMLVLLSCIKLPYAITGRNYFNFWGRPGAVWGILAFDQMLGQLGFRGVVFPISIIHCGILEVSVDKYFIQWNCLSRSMVKWIQEHQQMDFDNIHITSYYLT
jgi:hypothetical protein